MKKLDMVESIAQHGEAVEVRGTGPVLALVASKLVAHGIVPRPPGRPPDGRGRLPGPNGTGHPRFSTMRGYLAMTRAEFRLFRREPFAVVFVRAFPLTMMVLLAAVFGNNRADAGKIQNGMLVWRGLTPANYYTAASVAVIVAALGLLTLPINLARYRERGILRRFQASSVSGSTLVSAQLTLALVTFVAGTLVMAVVVRLAYHAMLPQDLLGVLVALLAGTAAFGAIGLLLATMIGTSRSAQGIGLLLSFALWLISGTAPPRALLPTGLRDVGGVLPLAHLVTAAQNPWLGLDWSGTDLAVLAAYAVAASVPALWLFRWD